MRIDLSNGNWADVREDMNGGDRRAAKAAVRFRVAEDGSREITGELEDKVKYVLLRRLILNWSFPPPLPRDAVDWEATLDNLPIEDIETLGEFAQPFYDRTMNGPKPRIVSGTILSTGTSDALE